MFETATRVAATETLADPLRVLDGLRLAANLAQARLVFQSGDLWEARVSAALSDPDGDRHADRAAVTDIAVVLGISRTAAHQMVTTMRELVRLPTLDEAFADGCIDYAKTRTITAILRHASSETCAAIEHRVLRDAMHLTPGPLRKAVWTAWMKASPKEAAKVREARRLGDRKVYVRHGEDSMCWLSACSTSIEGWEAQALIDELATSVCEHDPRTMDNRRADALLALLHGDGFLRCQCEDPTCPLATAAPPPRRAHLVEILVSIETLLGLSADPATLPDGTPVDPDVVRILAHDATWRAILTETHTLAHRHHPDIPAATPAPADTAAPVENPTPDPTPPAGTAHREPVAPGAGPTPEPAQSPATAETLADAETPEPVDVAVPETNAPTPPATAAHCEPVAPGAEPAAPVTEPTAESAESPAPAESPADAETPESADVATEAPSTEPDPPALATTAHCEPVAPRAEPATRVETPVPTETTAAASGTAAAAADPVRSQAGAPEPDSAVLASASAPRPDPVASLINTEPPVATALPPDFSPPPDTAPDRADVAPAAVEVDTTACQADPAATREHAPAPTATGVNDPVDAPVSGSGGAGAGAGGARLARGVRGGVRRDRGGVRPGRRGGAAVVARREQPRTTDAVHARGTRGRTVVFRVARTGRVRRSGTLAGR